MGDAPKGAYAAMVVRGDRGVGHPKGWLAWRERAAFVRRSGAPREPRKALTESIPKRDGAERR